MEVKEKKEGEEGKRGREKAILQQNLKGLNCPFGYKGL